MIRILHFSDVHLPTGYAGTSLAEFANKRLLGAANTLLRRRAKFRDARGKLAQLHELGREIGVDAYVNTGDYTEVGTEHEIREARTAIAPFLSARLGFVTMPGNHDVYVPEPSGKRVFHELFADLLRSDLPDLAAPDGWPLVRLLGHDVAVVCVESARPNPQIWRSSGRIPEPQLEALSRIFDDPRVRERFVLVATHYAPRRSNGTPDTKLHGVENGDALLQACRGVRHGALVHGHLHWRFHLPVADDRPVPIFGAGSATYHGREGFWVFEAGPHRARAIPGAYRDGRYVLEEQSAVFIG